MYHYHELVIIGLPFSMFLLFLVKYFSFSIFHCFGEGCGFRRDIDIN
jgi:hypothetical protein